MKTQEVFTGIEVIPLSLLEPGDIFRMASDKKKKPTHFVVKGSCMYKIRYGGHTRICVNLKETREVSKACDGLVIKVGESKHKHKINQHG